MKIQTHDLGKRFNYEWIFRHAELTLEPSQCYAVTGSNGSGKSTFLQVISGMLPPTTGSINYLDQNEKPVPVEDVYRKVSIAAPYQDLIEEFTLREQLEFHQKMRPFRENLNAKDIIGLAYLENASDKYLANFSSGMKQRVKLAIALFSQSDILLLDEPGSNLDDKAFDWYYGHLCQLTGQQMIIIASNNAAEYPPTSAVIKLADLKPSRRV